jgi:N-carbamoylputrescine amidase
MTKRTITVAALQLPLHGGRGEKYRSRLRLVEAAAGDGAQVILPPELFSGPYFCKTQEEALSPSPARRLEHPSVIAMAGTGGELKSRSPPASSNATARISTIRWR